MKKTLKIVNLLLAATLINLLVSVVLNLMNVEVVWWYHPTSGFLFLGFLLLHLFFNRKWVVSTYLKK